MGLINSTEEFITVCTNLHNGMFDYSKSIYTGSEKHIIIICKIHGEFSQIAKNHYYRKQGCSRCSGKKKKTTQEFILEANLIHNNRYSYLKSKYVNNNTYIVITCHIHGDFKQKPTNHLIQKSGCNECFGTKKINELEFIEVSNKIHNNYYSYTNVNYINTDIKVNITCPTHGSFSQTPYRHKTGTGCPLCAGTHVRSTKDFVASCKLIFPDYKYNKTTYINKLTKVIITCKIHGDFFKLPNSHEYLKQGCPKCSYGCVSNLEIEWISSLNNKNIRTNQVIMIGDKQIKPDGIDFNTNTIYEFYGDFWHGNPNIYQADNLHPFKKTKYGKRLTFGEILDQTINREILIKAAGYKLITIWEKDYKSII